jgi:hypothetical protein
MWEAATPAVRWPLVKVLVCQVRRGGPPVPLALFDGVTKASRLKLSLEIRELQIPLRKEDYDL